MTIDKCEECKNTDAPPVEKSILYYSFAEHLRVLPKLQSENYFKALENDSSGNKGIFNSSKEATLFIFPDGSYGSEGFSKYIEKNEKYN